MKTIKNKFILCAVAFLASCTVSSITLFSCGSTKAAEPAPVAETKLEEPAPVVEKTESDLEYERSVGDSGVSKDAFAADKAEILKIIAELDKAMKNGDYKLWLYYVNPESVEYWSTGTNLRKAEKRLPIKGIKLNNIGDYFKNVFVPSRSGREVNEIRYISDKEVKAVQVHEDQDIIYYYFNKTNGKWMVHIPPIAD